MSLKSLSGVLTHYAASPLFWLLSLSILLMSAPVLATQKELTVSKVPGMLAQAMQRALKGTPYQIHLVNWLAVSKMETAGWSSVVYTTATNPWGMRPSKERENTQDGVYVSPNNGEFARYKSLDRAAQDIVLYMKARQWPTSKMSMSEFVSRMKQAGYFGDVSVNEYLQAVEAWTER